MLSLYRAKECTVVRVVMGGAVLVSENVFYILCVLMLNLILRCLRPKANASIPMSTVVQLCAMHFFHAFSNQKTGPNHEPQGGVSCGTHFVPHLGFVRHS